LCAVPWCAQASETNCAAADNNCRSKPAIESVLLQTKQHVKAVKVIGDLVPASLKELQLLQEVIVEEFKNYEVFKLRSNTDNASVSSTGHQY